MSKKSPPFDFAKTLTLDAEDIIAAAARASVMHKSKDIRASGDEVEVAVRRYLSNKLPASFHVGHGHIVDVKWRTSPQLDVVISDAGSAPTLFRSEAGTTYFPYESVYAIGEVKTTYVARAGLISKFSSNLRNLHSNLHREKAPPSYLRGLTLGPGLKATAGSWLYRNPLFSFMIFVNSGDFELDDIRKLYYTTPSSELPNMVVFLDRGIIMCLRSRRRDGEESLEPEVFIYHPEFSSDSDGALDAWTFISLDRPEFQAGAGLGLLVTGLLEHLEKAVLMPVPFGEYLLTMLINQARGEPISPLYENENWRLIDDDGVDARRIVRGDGSEAATEPTTPMDP